ncbi:TnpV protein [Paenibacillus agaridevorans]|uniref:TnpV protein n=1 Tax=Paenibacillus agaridevorans TaxID=171404 RepID=UPI0031BA2DCE
MKLTKWKGRMSMELTYTRQGDYLLPNLALSEEVTPIGKYGMLRKSYLQTQQKGLYASLILSGKLQAHLTEIEQTLRQQLEIVMTQLLLIQPAPDKASEPMAWTAHMNSLKQQAEELLLPDLIYS